MNHFMPGPSLELQVWSTSSSDQEIPTAALLLENFFTTKDSSRQKGQPTLGSASRWLIGTGGHLPMPAVQLRFKLRSSWNADRLTVSVIQNFLCESGSRSSRWIRPFDGQWALLKGTRRPPLSVSPEREMNNLCRKQEAKSWSRIFIMSRKVRPCWPLATCLALSVLHWMSCNSWMS